MKAHQKGKNRKEVRNARLEKDALDDTEALFGRVVKALGAGNFLLCVQDPDHPERLLDEQHGHLAGKATARININDVVVVAESGRGGKAGKRQFEVIGSMSKKSISQLLQQKRLHPALVVERGASGGAGQDEGGVEFDYSEGDSEENEQGEGAIAAGLRSKAAKTAAFAAAAAPSKADRAVEIGEDLDIDNI